MAIESVKVAMAAAGGVDVNPKALSIPIAMGDDEIAIALAIVAISRVPTTAYSVEHYWALWRKADAVWPLGSLQPTSLAAQKDIVAAGSIIRAATATAAGTSISAAAPLKDTFVFPYPLPLIRPPQFLYQMLGSYNNHEIGVMLYYVTQKITRDEMTRLMVKDHE